MAMFKLAIASAVPTASIDTSHGIRPRPLGQLSLLANRRPVPSMSAMRVQRRWPAIRRNGMRSMRRATKAILQAIRRPRTEGNQVRLSAAGDAAVLLEEEKGGEAFTDKSE